MVEQDKVFAIVGTFSGVLTPQYVNQQQVPLVGAGENDAFCTHGAPLSSWYLFSFVGCLNPDNQVFSEGAAAEDVVQGLKAMGDTGTLTAEYIAEDNDASRAGIHTVSQAFSGYGIQTAAADSTVPPAPAVVSDWTPYVQRALTSNHGGPPSVVVTLMPTNATLPFDTALKQAGYKGMIWETDYSPDPVTTKNSAGFSAGLNWASGEMAALGDTNMATMKQQLAAAGQNSVGAFQEVGWFSADMFVDILKAVGPNLTAQRFQQVASHFTYSIPGVVGPTVYPTGFASGSPCGELMTDTGTTWKVIVPYSCGAKVLNTQTKQLIPYSAVDPMLKY
jgi:hypothetical protein